MLKITARHILKTLLAALSLAAPAKAVILFGLDNSSNRTNPGTGVPFDAVGLITDAGRVSPMGSAIHLGGGYMLTANHVFMQPYVTFDGTTFYNRDLSFSPRQVAPNVDMQIFKLSSTPTVGAVNLYSGSSEQIAPATLVGWGVGRNPTVPVDSASVNWGVLSTSEKRWGTNVPRDLVGIAYQSGGYAAIRTVLGSDSGLPAGLGDNEAAATVIDSGSGLFQNISGTWYLIGLTSGAEAVNTSRFGNDAVAGVGKGDANYFVRISAYRSNIVGLIPEPSTALMLVFALPLLLKRTQKVAMQKK